MHIQGGFLCLLKLYFDFTCLKFPFRNVLSLLLYFLFCFGVFVWWGFLVCRFWFWGFFWFPLSRVSKRKGEKEALMCSYFFFFSLFLEVAQGWRWSLLFLSLVALRFTSFVLRTLLFEILFFKSAGSKGWWAPASAAALGQRVFFLNNSHRVLLYFIFPWNVSWICWCVKGSSEACTHPLFFIVFWLFYFSLCYKLM